MALNRGYLTKSVSPRSQNLTASIRFLFDEPQHEIASLIRGKIEECTSTSIASGFVTVDGIESILSPLRSSPNKLHSLVVGAATYRAFQAIDILIAAGISENRISVHLGHTRETKTKGAASKFYKYHPMLHSKIYLMDLPGNRSAVFVGSHNLTSFAMMGLNSEASMLLEDFSDAKEISDVRAHLDKCRAQALQYSPGMKESLSWWTNQFFTGLRDRANDQPREGEARTTIVILAVQGGSDIPKEGEIIYFELPAILGQVRSLNADVHVYIFKNKPPSPAAGLAALANAVDSIWCKTAGLEIEQGGQELAADWYVEKKNPQLTRAPRPFRPQPAPGIQQVRVKVQNKIFYQFEYLFHSASAKWVPILDDAESVQAKPEDQSMLRALKLIPPHDKPWFLVKGLRPDEPSDKQKAYHAALREAGPEGDTYILFSIRRINLSKKKEGKSS